MNGRMRPIDRVRDQPVFDRIDVHIIHMCLEIAFVTYGVFPKAFLPQIVIPAGVFCEWYTRFDEIPG